MINFKNKKFNKACEDVALRCIKTFAQSMLGSLTGLTMISEVHFSTVLSTALFSALYAFLFNLSKLKVGDDYDEL